MSTATTTTPRKRGRARPVVQYARDGRWLTEFPSARAACAATGVDFGNITKVANRKRGMTQAGGYVWLWADDTEHWFREYARTRDVALRNRLVEHFHDVAVRVARKAFLRLPNEVQFGDVVSAATFGLFDAIEKFDPARGIKFSTYAGRRVAGAILDWQREQDWVPRLVRQRDRRIERAKDALRCELGSEPTAEQMAGRLRLTAHEYTTVAAQSRPVQVESISRCLWAGNKEVRPVDTLSDPSAPDPANNPNNHESLRDVLLKHFSLSQALVVRLYHVDDLTMREIGEAVSLSESRVSQMHTQVLHTLKARYTFEQLRELIGEAA